MPRKASVRDVRRTNRALLMRELLLGGSTTRSELGAVTGLSPATVTNVVTDLLHEGTVREEGFEESMGGRRRVVLKVVGSSASVIGCDVSEVDIRTELFDLTLGRLAARRTRFEHRTLDPEKAERIIARHVDDLLAEAGIERSTVLGLGLGVPGIVSQGPQFSPPFVASTVVVDAPAIGWHDVTFERLPETLGFEVFIDNGAKTTTQAESWFGAARGCRHAVMVLIGAGAGAGIITDGRLYRGHTSSAGEWGHTKISVDGPACLCGSFGCVDMFVGARAVLERWTGSEAWSGDEQAGVTALFDAILDGDESARRLLQQVVEHLGLALSNLVNLYNPEKLVVGGWFGELLAAHDLAGITAATRRYSLAQPGGGVSIVRSQPGIDAVALGAATLPIDHFIHAGRPLEVRPAPQGKELQ